jgi:hypothetical protein
VVHGALFLAALWLLAPLLAREQKRLQYILWGFILLVFCDVMYVCLLSSFYMDAAAYVFLLLSAVSYLRMLRWGRHRDIALFAVCSLLFVTAKTQHAPLGFWIAGLLLVAHPRSFRPLALCLTVAAALMMWVGVPRGYSLDSCYNMTFYQILPHSRDVNRNLADLGLDESYKRYIGMNCFLPGSGMDDDRFRGRLARRLSVFKLGRFYLTHPRDTYQALEGVLAEAGRQRLFGNFATSAGYPPGTESRAFALWSGAKNTWFFHHGGRVVAAFLAIPALFGVLLYGTRQETPPGVPIAGFVLIGMALTELLISALGDPLDAPRHLLLSFALLDMMLIAGGYLAVCAQRLPAIARPAVPELRLLQNHVLPGRLAGVASLALIAVYFFRLARPALHLGFSHDDMMNLYGAWFPPAASLVKDNFLFFTASRFGRPLGEAWYRIVFHFAGMRPFLYHAVLLAIVLLNIMLTYAVAHKLTRSRAIAAVAALLFSYQPKMAFVYFDSGYIFDALCYFFYAATLLLYLRVRNAGRRFMAWQAAALLILYVCALNSKEMAITLPVMLVIYELIFHNPGARTRQDWWNWTRNEAWLPATMAAMTAAYVIGRCFGPFTLVHMPAYKPVITWSRFMETSTNFFGGTPAWQVLLLWTALFTIAWISPSRVLRFAACFLFLTALPMAFVSPRGQSQYYVCWFGWSLYGAVVAVAAARWLTPLAWRDHTAVAQYRNAALLLVLTAVLYPQYKHPGWRFYSEKVQEGSQYYDWAEQLHGLEPAFPPHSRILFLNDPVPAEWWNMLFLVRLSYGDRSLVVDRTKQTRPLPEPGHYDYVFDYRDGRFLEVKGPAGGTGASHGREATAPPPLPRRSA